MTDQVVRITGLSGVGKTTPADETIGWQMLVEIFQKLNSVIKCNNLFIKIFIFTIIFWGTSTY